jgi:hypothetical protein
VPNVGFYFVDRFFGGDLRGKPNVALAEVDRDSKSAGHSKAELFGRGEVKFVMKTDGYRQRVEWSGRTGGFWVILGLLSKERRGSTGGVGMGEGFKKVEYQRFKRIKCESVPIPVYMTGCVRITVRVADVVFGDFRVAPWCFWSEFTLAGSNGAASFLALSCGRGMGNAIIRFFF